MGVVIGRSGENWRVDIGSAHMATLDGLAFEGATKRNRPNLKVRVRVIHNASRCGLRQYAGRIVALCTRILGTQGYGTGTRVFRRPNAQS